ncbi:MAG: glycosyltransferase family 2 protein [Oscillospiraceae bacterium]|jgi:glycosyltransferase involved in cell wall biosynthesis
MKIKHSIDRLLINETESGSTVRLRGWCLADDASVPEIYLRINGEKTECLVNHESRPDVVSALIPVFNKNGIYDEAILKSNAEECGFVICLENYREKIQTIDLAAAVNGDEENIWGVSGRRIDRFTLHSRTVLCFIEAPVFDRGSGECTVFGWADDPSGDEIEFHVVDSDGNEIEHQVYGTFCPEPKELLIDLKDVPEKGFKIVFPFGEGNTYFIKTRTSSEEALFKIPLSNGNAGHAKFYRGIQFLKPYIFKHVLKSIRDNGKTCGVRKAYYIARSQMDRGDYDFWLRAHAISNKELKAQKESGLEEKLKISLLVPAFNTPPAFLKRMLNSVINQSYSNWELCIADGSEEDSPARRIIREYSSRDSRIKAVYLSENYGISGNTNRALDIATGDYIALFDHDDFLEPDALYQVAKAIYGTGCDVVYTDEDKYSTKDKIFRDPNFKPDFSIDLLRSDNYITHLFVVKAELIKEIGGFRSRFDGSQDFDVILRCTEKAENIKHLSRVLYHWRMHGKSTAENPESKLYCYEAGKRALDEHLVRQGINAESRMYPKPLYGQYRTVYAVDDKNSVSIVLSGDKSAERISNCLESILKIESHRNIEIILPLTEKKYGDSTIADAIVRLKNQYGIDIIAVNCGSGNTMASQYNIGAQKASGDFILFLDSSLTMIRPDSIEEMLGIAMRKDVGTVGARILRHNGTVFHAGVVFEKYGKARNTFEGVYREDPGYLARPMVCCDYSAISPLCMMASRDTYLKLKGFDDKFHGVFSGYDFCLRSGKLSVYTPFSEWIISEDEKLDPEETVDELFKSKWNKLFIEGDPFYNSGFEMKYLWSK